MCGFGQWVGVCFAMHARQPTAEGNTAVRFRWKTGTHRSGCLCCIFGAFFWILPNHHFFTGQPQVRENEGANFRCEGIYKPFKQWVKLKNQRRPAV